MEKILTLELLKRLVSYHDFEKRVKRQFDSKKSFDDCKKFYKHLTDAKHPTLKLISLNLLEDLRYPFTKDNFKIVNDYVTDFILNSNSPILKTGNWEGLFK